MVAGIIGPAAVLLDDDPLRIARTAAYFRVHIVLSIVAAREPSLTILKCPATDISKEGFALTFLNRFQQVFGFL
jgi:hypothetical protein